MPRESYYQDVGNPIRHDQLPSRPLTITFPYPDARPLVMAVSSLKVIGAALALDIVDWASRQESCTADFASARAIALALVSITAVTICSSAIPGSLASAAYFSIGLASSLLASLAFLTSTETRLTWIHAGIVSMGYIWLFTTHWIDRCLASPMNRETGQELRTRWRRTAAFHAAVSFLVIAIAIVTVPVALPRMPVWVIEITSVILVIGLARVDSSNAFASLVTYNVHDRNAPGVLESPAGKCSMRTAAVVAISFVITSCIRQASPVPVVLPSLVALSIPAIFSGALLREANTYRRDGVPADRWKTNISNLRSSSNPIERKSYYIASVLSDNSPVLLPRDGLIHGHFLGDTGGGKTSLGLLPFIEQTIGFGDASVVVIDLKADKLELMSTMQAAAAHLREQKAIDLPLKYLSTCDGYACFALNPMTQPFWKDLSSYQKTDLLTAAAGLQYGNEFGEAFYSSTNAAVINETFQRFPDVQTFQELAEKCNLVVTSGARGGLHAEVRKNGTHALEVLKRLASFPPLNVSEDGEFPSDVLDEAIDLADVFRRPQMMYFHLNSTLSPGAAPALARFVTFFLLAAANTVERNAPVYLIIDEFQRMAASNFEYMLQLARSMGVHIILANQSMEDLKNSKSDLIPTIEANCGFRQWFSVTSSDDRQRLVESSGQTVEYFTSVGTSHSGNGTTISRTRTEQLLPRISHNDIAMMSDHMLHSIVSIARGSGYARYGGLPFICKSDFHISKEEYDRRQAMPWPSKEKGTFIPDKRPRKSQPLLARASGPPITTEIIGGDKNEDPFSDFLNDLRTEDPPSGEVRKQENSQRGRRRR